MPFDLKKFNKAKFEHRTQTVLVPSLTSFFEDGEKAEFVVRGLTGEELAKVNTASAKGKSIAALVEALAGGNQIDKVNAIRENLGLSDDDLPEDLARRIEMLSYGCVDPTLDQQTAVKLFKVAPVDSFSLSNTITSLSGQGMLLGEQRPSGKTKT